MDAPLCSGKAASNAMDCGVAINIKKQNPATLNAGRVVQGLRVRV
jgi:hypothetical protein